MTSFDKLVQLLYHTMICEQKKLFVFLSQNPKMHFLSQLFSVWVEKLGCFFLLPILIRANWVFCYQRRQNRTFSEICISITRISLKRVLLILAKVDLFWGQTAQFICLTLIQIIEGRLTVYCNIIWCYLNYINQKKYFG